MSDDKFIFDFEYKIRKQIQEDEENFVYTAILPFCETITEKKLSKKELEEILRKGMKYSNLLDKIKKAREDIENEIKFWSEPSKYNVKSIVAINNAKVQSYKHCLEILDKLIESEV